MLMGLAVFIVDDILHVPRSEGGEREELKGRREELKGRKEDRRALSVVDTWGNRAKLRKQTGM